MEEQFFEEAAKIASRSLCLNRRCGSVVAKNNKIIGTGYNAPPLDDVKSRRCKLNMNKRAKYPTDKTCCIHAEQRAIFDALNKHPKSVKGATVYFASIDKLGRIEYAGKPYCTLCSKLALDLGLKRFGLWHKSGFKIYEITDYNELSYKYGKRG